MSSEIVILLFTRVVCAKNTVQYQRAQYACESHDTWILTRREICSTIEEKAANTCVSGESILLRIFFPLWLVITVHQISKQREVKYVHTNHNPQTLLAGYVLHKLGYVWVADIYDSPHIGLDLEDKPEEIARYFAYIYNRTLVSIVKRTLRRADLVVVAMVPDILEEYGLTASDSNVLQVTNGVDITYTQNFNKPYISDNFRLVYVGPVQKSRSVDIIIDALRKIESADKAIELRLVGGVREQDAAWVVNHISELNHTMVSLLGRVSHDEALEEINKADVGLCPLSVSIENYKYAYPIKVFEYMALEKAIIATETDGLKKILDNGRTGLLVPPNDVDAMSEALLNLYSNSRFCTELGKNAGREVENYDWDRINEKISARIQELIA